MNKKKPVTVINKDRPQKHEKVRSRPITASVVRRIREPVRALRALVDLISDVQQALEITPVLLEIGSPPVFSRVYSAGVVPDEVFTGISIDDLSYASITFQVHSEHIVARFRQGYMEITFRHKPGILTAQRIKATIKEL